MSSSRRAPLGPIKRNAPSVTARGPLSAKARPGKSAGAKSANAAPGIPCADEKEYHDVLLPKQQALARQLVQEQDRLRALETNILEFYYANDICFEGAVFHGETAAAGRRNRSPSSALGAGDSSAHGAISSAVPFSTDQPASPLQVGALPDDFAAPRGTHYYRDSVISRLVAQAAREAAERRRAAADAEHRVAAMEAAVERDVIHGTLAAANARQAEAEEQLTLALAGLEEARARVAALAAEMEELSTATAAVEAESAESVARQAELERKKQMQMDNVDATRAQLQEARLAAEEAEKDLRKRQWVIRDLERQIEWRTKRLKKRKE